MIVSRPFFSLLQTVLSRLLWAIVFLSGLACGKRGDPLPPLRRHPAAVERLDVMQRGPFIHLEWNAPERNRDGSAEVELASAEILRRVMEPPPNTEEPEPPSVGEAVEAQEVAEEVTEEPTEPTPRPAVAPFPEGATVIATLESTRQGELLTYRDPWEPSWGGKLVEYAVRHINRKGRQSALSPVARIEPLAPLAPPAAPETELDDEGVHLRWSYAGTPNLGSAYLIGFDVYRRAGADPYPSTPLNPKPLSNPRYIDGSFELGKRLCYAVRAVALPREEAGDESAASGREQRELEGTQHESLDSAEVCLTPEDRFAPPTPENLIAVEVAEGILLSWKAVDVADLAGYVVYRARDPEGPYDRLTTEPLQLASFTDRDTEAGALYHYAVSAVDRSQPPNESPRSSSVSIRAPE